MSDFIIHVNEKNKENILNQFETVLNGIVKKISFYIKTITKNLNTDNKYRFYGTEEEYEEFIKKIYNEYVNPVDDPDKFIIFKYGKLSITNGQLQYELKKRFSQRVIKNYFKALFNNKNNIVFKKSR